MSCSRNNCIKLLEIQIRLGCSDSFLFGVTQAKRGNISFVSLVNLLSLAILRKKNNKSSYISAETFTEHMVIVTVSNFYEMNVFFTELRK